LSLKEYLEPNEKGKEIVFMYQKAQIES